ncbi:MAG: TolC family protein, partial [Deefgea sp.]
MQSKRFNAPILWCIFIALPAHAATIKDAFELASQIDVPVQVAQRVKAQSALRNAESLTPEPLSLTVSGTNSLNDHLSPTQGAREYEAELGIPLWQWGQKERLLTQLKQSSQAEQSQLLLSRWALAGAVREAVWAARLAQLEQQNAAQILKSLEDIAQNQARQLKAGEVSPLDANLANQAVLEAQLQLAQRQQELKAHLQHFHSLVGEPMPVPEQDEDLPAQHDVIHPQRVVLQAESELARAHLAQSQYDTRDNPELALSLTRERGSPGEEFKNLGKISLR